VGTRAVYKEQRSVNKEHVITGRIRCCFSFFLLLSTTLVLYSILVARFAHFLLRKQGTCPVWNLSARFYSLPIPLLRISKRTNLISICSFVDMCPDDHAKTHTGECGCGTSDLDTDNDGTPDCKGKWVSHQW